MEWRADGHVLIACNCDYGCPCNFNARPTQGECEGGWIWSIMEGEVEGVGLDGLALAVLADWPAAIHEGGGRAAAFVDDRADERQRQALTRLVRGELGGPWGIFINTYELSGPEPARFELELADHGTRARIGEAVELEMAAIRNPVTDAEFHAQIHLPAGIVTKEPRMATSRIFRVRGGVEYDHSGRYAAFGPFSYAGG